MNPLLDVLGAMGVVGIVLGWGWALERMLGFRGSVAGLGWLGRICLGVAHWVCLVFLLAAVGALRLGPLLLASVVSGSVLLVYGRGAQKIASDSAEANLPKPGVVASICLLGLLTVLSAIFCVALYPSVSWDADTYHLGVPRLYLAHGGFRELPFIAYSNWPLATEMLFTLAMLVRGFVSAKLVHFAAGCGLLYGLWVAMREQPESQNRPWIAALLPVALLLANDVVLEEFPIAYVELAHGFFLLSATLFVSRAMDQPEVRTQCLWMAGVAGGLLASVKVSGVVGSVLVFSLLLPTMLRVFKTQGLGTVGRAWLVPLCLPVVLLWFPWLLKSQVLSSNPFYPVLYGVFGGRWWDVSLSEQLAAWIGSMGMGRSPIDFLLLPLRVIFQGGPGYANFDGALFQGWVLALPLGLWACKSSALARRCMGVGGAFFVFWAFSSQQMRLVVPVLPLFAVAASLGVLQVCRGAWGRRVSEGLLVVLVGATIWVAKDRLEIAPQVLQRLSNPSEAESRVPPVYRFIREDLPLDARLLLLNTNHCFFCDRDYIADSFFEASQLAWWASQASDEDALYEALLALGITHVFWGRGQWGIDYPANLLSLVQNPERVELLYGKTGAGARVLALR